LQSKLAYSMIWDFITVQAIARILRSHHYFQM